MSGPHPYQFFQPIRHHGYTRFVLHSTAPDLRIWPYQGFIIQPQIQKRHLSCTFYDEAEFPLRSGNFGDSGPTWHRSEHGLAVARIPRDTLAHHRIPFVSNQPQHHRESAGHEKTDLVARLGVPGTQDGDTSCIPVKALAHQVFAVVVYHPGHTRARGGSIFAQRPREELLNHFDIVVRRGIVQCRWVVSVRANNGLQRINVHLQEVGVSSVDRSDCGVEPGDGSM